MALAETATLMVDIKVGQNQLPGASAAASRAVNGLEGAAGRVSVATTKFGGALNHAGSQLKNLIAGPLGLAGLGIGLFSVGGALEKGIDKARDFGDEVRRMSALTGLSTETTSALAAALDHFGVSSTSAIRLTGFLEKNVGLLAARKDGVVNFEKDFGLALRDANGHLKDANELILTTADYFNNKSIPSTQKAAALAKLFGRSWQELIPFLSAGRQGIQDAEREAAKFGLTLTKDNITALVAMKKATRDWGDALGGLELQIGLALVPALTDLARTATKFVSENRAGIVGFFKDGVKFAGQLGDVIRTRVVPVFSAIKSGWDSLPGPFRDLLVTGLATDRTVKFLFGFSPIKFAADALGGALGKTLGGLIGKNIVQPVFVTNQIPGGGGIPGAAGGGGLGTLLKFTAALGLGALAVDLFVTKLAPLNDSIAQQTRDLPKTLAESFKSVPTADLTNELNASIKALNDFHQTTDGLGAAQDILYGDQRRTLEANILAIKAEMAARQRGTTTANIQGRDESSFLGPRSIGGIGEATGVSVAKHLIPALDALHRDLQENLRTLRHSTDPARVAAAAKRVQRDVEKGAGSVAGSERIIHDLMRQLHNTHDPQLQAVLRAAIHSVEAKLPNRRFVEGQYAAAVRTEKSGATTARQIHDLTAIQRSLLAHGDTHAAARIGKDIQVLRDRLAGKSDRANSLLAGIKAKRTQFTVNNVVNTSVAVSVRSFESRQKQLSKFSTTVI